MNLIEEDVGNLSEETKNKKNLTKKTGSLMVGQKQNKTIKRAIQNWKRLRNWKIKSAVQKLWANMHIWNPNLFVNFGLKPIVSRTRIAGMI